jgi:vacuolar-type H+-ATPase subunit H
MQEIVNRVLEAEQQAEKTVQDARVRAAEMRKRADDEAEGKLKAAREKAQSFVQESLTEAHAQAAREQREARAEAERQNVRFLEERGDAIEAAAGAVVSLLATPEHQRRNAEEPVQGGSGA